ncbi:MAG TPA: hypothetical protein VGO69_07605 [Pyrinomonadaceae bacterium]|jgi:hypothetical protein|nr:hypothetical protein [Pyrinomonadaceae bacterium]
MSASLPEFNRGVVKPVECLRGGWNLIKDQYWLFLGLSLAAVFIGSAVPMGILLGPMMCGVYLALFRRQRGEPVTFNLLFKGFDFFGESVVATLIHVVPMLLVLLPTYLISFAFFFATVKPQRRGQPPDFFPFFIFFIVIFLFIMIVSIIIGVFFAFTYPLIVDRRLSGVNAVKTSIKAATANLGGVLGLMLLSTVLGFAGVLLCYVGAIFMMPISFAAWSIAYRQVFSAQDTPPAPPVF